MSRRISDESLRNILPETIEECALRHGWKVINEAISIGLKEWSKIPDDVEPEFTTHDTRGSDHHLRVREAIDAIADDADLCPCEVMEELEISQMLDAHDCPHCEGTGWVLNNYRPCFSCLGTGKKWTRKGTDIQVFLNPGWQDRMREEDS